MPSLLSANLFVITNAFPTSHQPSILVTFTQESQNDEDSHFLLDSISRDRS
jgi:hypothetical protein